MTLVVLPVSGVIRVWSIIVVHDVSAEIGWSDCDWIIGLIQHIAIDKSGLPGQIAYARRLI